MKRSEQDRLLREILGGDATEELRRRSLEQGLAALHRRRRTRRLSTGALAAAAVAAFVALVATQQADPPPTGPLVASDPSPAGITYITDDELRALLADRSYALIGPPGQQQFIPLDPPDHAPL